MMACFARVVTSSLEGLAKPSGVVAGAVPAGYGPADLQDAYKLTAQSASAGTGRTIAIVDAQDDPSIESDLALYRSTFGLPPCTSASGCFQKVNQFGQTSPLPQPDTGWASEMALDLEMASAICPNCNLLLVEANSANNSDLDTAANTAAAWPGVVAVSNSYGGGESSSDTSDASYNHPGIAITASSGDEGFVVEFPAASGALTAVGGTSLVKDPTTARGWTETVWSTSNSEGTGSGCSEYETKPTWQTDTGCLKRTVGDVSADADPATGVAVYDSYGSGGWAVFGGTSLSSPLIAGVYALASPPNSGDYPVSYAYANPGAFFDVTVGQTSSSCSSYLCKAQVGYDGPTGWGTPNGIGGFQPLSANDFSISASPATLNLLQGTSGSSTISTAITTGVAQTINLSISGVPAGATATFNPTSVTAGASSTLTVAAGTTAAGTYTLTITGTGTSATHTTTVVLTITTPPVNDFSIAANPTSLSLVQGTSGTSTISTAVTSGSSQTVKLAISGLPAGATASLSPASLAAGASSTVTMNAGTAGPGAYTATITGTGVSATHSTSITLAITPTGADFSIAASPSSLTVSKLGIGTFKVAVTAMNGFSGRVTFSLDGLPSKVAGVFLPSYVNGSGTSYFIFVVGLKQASGTFPLTITGTSGSLVHSTNVTLNVK
ncbi:MAG TPA: hypothetical protein VMH04_16735 [Candidatus Solibacter sp.]|nr:hypothetical protein [Candidatus Solibacter sp.]